MAYEEKAKRENEGIELDDNVLEDVSGGESTDDINNVQPGGNLNINKGGGS